MRPSLEQIAASIFGPADRESIERWVDYWRSSRKRNRRLLDSFRELVLFDTRGKRLLDVGCGTGGMAELLEDPSARYVGADYHRHVLQFVPRGRSRHFLQCSGTDLPFRDGVFHYVFAFDVIEHLTGGLPWQRRFLSELRRVLHPLGMIFLTTPNLWYPYEGHTDLYFPQYLPVSLADRYIARRNPGFLKEHGSFAEIRLLTPRRLRRSLRAAGLSFLHDLPCGTDRGDYLQRFPLRGLLAWLGLGWYPHAELRGIAVRRESHSGLRRKLKKHWYFELNQPSRSGVRDFASKIDFREDRFGYQLGSGWYWHEEVDGGYRWIGKQAVCYLQSEGPVEKLRLRGASQQRAALEVRADGERLGRLPVRPGHRFDEVLSLTGGSTADRIFEIRLRCSRTHRPADPSDVRKRLGLQIFSIELL